jgi:stress response protein YsnF
MAREKVVALFDSADDARVAVKNLNTAGYGNTSVISKETVGRDDYVAEPGFWKKLFGKGVEEYEAKVYAHSVDKGGAAVALQADNKNLAEAGGLLAAHKAVDIKKRAVDAGILTPKAAESIAERTVAVPKLPIDRELDHDAVLKLAKESINVGKKVVETGTTRLRRYVVETPVSESVTLHDEHAEIWEKAINEPADLRDVDWEDASIAVRETAEVPFESKSVRYVGEVGIRKVGTDRVATVHDTVREQHVEVDDNPDVDIPLPEGWVEEA